MNNIKLTLLLIFAALCCASCEKEETSQQQSEMKLEGSWQLVKYIPHSQGEKEWVSYGDTILYQKHLTKDHFTWFSYDTKNERILGMGGGTYIIKNDQYIENIEFFYPPGSNEYGQAIPFDIQLKDGKWHHIGYAKQMAVNMESGKLEVIDSTRIEETWEKTSISPNENQKLVGTWDLVSYRDSINGEYTEYPPYVGYLKLLTPTHFTWVYYDKHGDEIYAAGSGRYLFDGMKYSEAIDMLFPDNLGQIGSTLSFTTKVNYNSWKHVGYMPEVVIDGKTGLIIKDSSLIDEKWKLHEVAVMDGITF